MRNLLKRAIAAAFAVMIIFSLRLNTAAYSASAYILYDPDTGSVLTSCNAYERRSMASTTKIMTALLLCEDGRLNRLVKVKAKSVCVEGTSIGLKGGDIIPRENLLYGLLLESGNDAANVIAAEIAGDSKNFAEKMNEKATQIGMKRTHFVTPSGLDDKEHYTCCYDMALLAAYAMNNADFRKACSTLVYRSVYNNESTVRTYTNHNRLLRELDGCIGIKTGFTKKSGRCLVTACERDGKRLIAVTLCAPDDWNDHKAMYNYGFLQYENVLLPDNFNLSSIAVVGGDKTKVDIACESISVMLHKDYGGRVNYVINLPPFVYAPIRCGDTLGTVEYYADSKLIATAKITAQSMVARQLANEPTTLERIINYISIMLRLC